ncbi:MAG: HEAT repeat domain-containing protein [bacterium]|nr:HEAT repeat domain-containing protein [bacterium]
MVEIFNAPATDKLRVLVIDDQAHRFPYRQILMGLDCDVRVELSGHRGYELAVRYHPNLILLDYNLPDLEGPEVVRKLRGNIHTAPIPILMVTMADDPEAMRRAKAVGADAFLLKSASLDEIEAAITRLLEPARAALAKPKTESRTALRIPDMNTMGTLFQKSPSFILPALAQKGQEEWVALLAEACRSPIERLRGQAVIALAAWQHDMDAPFNPTDGQYIFWKHVRHSLASSTRKEAETHWAKLAPLALAAIQPLDKLTGALRACMDEPYWECRAWALRMLHSNREPVAVELAEQALGDDSGEVRTMAAQVLSETGVQRHIPLLTQAMTDPQPGVREHAAAALARIGGELSISALATVLLSGRSGGAEAAANGLALIGTAEAEDALMEALSKRTEPAVLQQVAHAFGKIGSERSLNALRWLVGHPEGVVKLAAQQYL